MSRYPKTGALVVLMLFSFAIQPCPAQTAPQNGPRHSPSAGGQFDAPENDMGLYRSEWAFRLNATHKVMPEFPEEALKAGAQGVVVLSLYQDSDGNAAQIKVAESPHPALTRAAITAVKQWRWRKFMSGGIYRPILGKLSFKFIIEDESGRVEDPADDGALRSLRVIHALRLKANWPDEAAQPVNQDNPE